MGWEDSKLMSALPRVFLISQEAHEDETQRICTALTYVNHIDYPTYLTNYSVIVNKFKVTLEHCSYAHIKCRNAWPLYASF